MVSLLLAYGADVNRGNGEGWSALMDASTKGNCELLRRLLMMGAEPNAVSASGETALSQAMLNGHHDVVQILLTAGAVASRCQPPIELLLWAVRIDAPNVIDAMCTTGC